MAPAPPPVLAVPSPPLTFGGAVPPSPPPPDPPDPLVPLPAPPPPPA